MIFTTTLQVMVYTGIISSRTPTLCCLSFDCAEEYSEMTAGSEADTELIARLHLNLNQGVHPRPLGRRINGIHYTLAFIVICCVCIHNSRC